VDTSVSLTLAGKYWPRSRWRASGAEHAVLLIVDQIDPCRKSSEDRSRNEGAVPRSAPLLRRSLFDTVRYGDPFRRGSRKIPAPWSDVEALLFFFSFFLLGNRPSVRPSVYRAGLVSDLDNVSYAPNPGRVQMVSRSPSSPSLPRGFLEGARWRRGLKISDPSINRDYVRVIVVCESTRGDDLPDVVLSMPPGHEMLVIVREWYLWISVFASVNLHSFYSQGSCIRRYFTVRGMSAATIQRPMHRQLYRAFRIEGAGNGIKEGKGLN